MSPRDAATIKVLIVDDSVVVRRLVQRALETDGGIEVVATASDGRDGIEKVRQLEPDVVTLDIEMPVMDGLTTLAAIRKTHPRLPVIMFSTLTRRSASATLDALSLGANDYVTKPTHLGSMDDAVEHLRTELLPRVRALAGPPAALPAAPAKRAAPAGPSPPPGRSRLTTSSPSGRPGAPVTRSAGPARAAAGARPGTGAGAARPTRPATTVPAPMGTISMVAIGVSTGGPNALNDLVPLLPGNLAAPVLIVQHMPPLFTRILAERLDLRSPLHVVEAADGDLVEPGGVWIAPGGHHMVLTRAGRQARISLNDDPPENSCRPAVDPMFRSVADAYPGQVLGVILTGMGQDGLHGSEAVQAAGGRVLAQDEATSVVWGMPGFVVRHGLADAVLPLDGIGPEIVRIVNERRRTPATRPAERP